MNEPDLVLNNLQWVICHKTKPNQTVYPETYSEISVSFKVEVGSSEMLFNLN